MATALKKFIEALFISFFTNWVEDFFIASGLILIIVNTYLISTVKVNILAGNYLLGFVLLLLGLILAKR